MSDSGGAAEEFSLAGVELRKDLIQKARQGDLALAREAFTNPDPRVRASSIAVLAENNELDDELVTVALGDIHPTVRASLARAACSNKAVPIVRLLNDQDSRVVEVACWAAGEREESEDVVVEMLSTIALDHDDALCRESAVAALGAIGDSRGLESILQATQDIATVRRRAVIALAPFEGQAVSDALEVALTDRDWQVRQAAEDILGFTAE